MARKTKDDLRNDIDELQRKNQILFEENTKLRERLKLARLIMRDVKDYLEKGVSSKHN